MSRMTAKKTRFVAEYLVDFNASKAAERAGYSPKTAYQIGHELLKKPEIQEAIREGQLRVAQRLEISQDRIAQELAKIAFANLADFVRTTPDGGTYIDMSAATRDQMAALSGIDTEEVMEGKDDDARNVRKIKIKMSDKRSALMDLAKLCGFVVEKKEITGKDGGAIETKDVSENEMARRVAFMLAKGMHGAAASEPAPADE